MPVLDDVSYDRLVGGGQFDFSPAPSGHGTLVYRRTDGGASEMLTLQRVRWGQGKTSMWPLPGECLKLKPGFYDDLSLSPDGTRMALQVNDGGSRDVWVFDQRRDAMTRLTFGGAFIASPAWSPDGNYVAFSSLARASLEARADSAGQPQALTQSKTLQNPRLVQPGWPSAGL